MRKLRYREINLPKVTQLVRNAAGIRRIQAV